MAFKQRVFSGVQPTGNLHLGNYLGAIVKFVELQKNYDCIYCVVDLHAITVWQDPAELPKAIREVTAAFLACGIDPKQHIVFNQSQVAEHAELAWVFNCVARLGWLNRMTQFKEKAGKDRENASVGLYAYPALMAADILVYRATHVPVGEDQKQHLELSRDIAQKFNNDFAKSIHAHGYGEAFFPLPEPLIQGPATRVMSLRDGTKKMSKSDASDQSRINLTDDADAIALKVRRAKTDPEPLPTEEKGLDARPEADNLVGIYAALAETTQGRGARAVRRRAVLDLQVGAGRSRGRQARADQFRDEEACRRPALYRFGAGRRFGARAGARRRDHEGRQGHRRASCGAESCGAAERFDSHADACKLVAPPSAVADSRYHRGAAVAFDVRRPPGKPMSKKRRSYEAGHSPKFLVVIDDTPECDRAVYFASRRALRIGATVIMLRVIEMRDRNQQWLGVGDIMRAEAHEEANAVLDRYAARASSITGVMPERVIREGDQGEGTVRSDRGGRGYRRSWCSPPEPARMARARWSRASPSWRTPIRSPSPSCPGT